MTPLRTAAAIAMLLIAGQVRAPARHSEGPPELAGGLFAYDVRSTDTLASVGARFGVDAATVAAGNGLPPNARLSPGQTLQIDNRHIVPGAVDAGALLVNVPQRMLFLGRERAMVEMFPIAVGKANWRTPLGPFQVRTMERNPTWDVPESILDEARRAGRTLPLKVPPGPDNPLGKFWLGLTLPGVGIHGTNVPSSIFKAATHGCMRMHPDDIARLFELVAVGTPGRTIYLPVLLAVHEGRVYVEAHRDVYRRAAGDPLAAIRALAEDRGVAERIDWGRAAAVIEARQGIARDVTREPEL
jgi:L,D-transpeptidase ErfK/SrfK